MSYLKLELDNRPVSPYQTYRLLRGIEYPLPGGRTWGISAYDPEQPSQLSRTPAKIRANKRLRHYAPHPITPDNLVWSSFYEDVERLKPVIQALHEVAGLSDVLMGVVSRDFFALLDVIPLYQALHSPQIAVTKAHQGTTPKTHTEQVFLKLKTDRLPTLESQLLARVAALFHDTAKTVAAAHDYWLDHPTLGSIMTRRLAQALCFNPQQVEVLQTVVYYHHIFEWVGYFPADKPRLAEILHLPNIAPILVALALADVRSVPEYARHAQNVIALCQELAPEQNLPI